MTNKTLFSSASGRLPRATTINQAGGAAYQLPAKAALAQLAATGCFGDTYYGTAEDQLLALVTLAGEVDAEYLAKLAVYARDRALMKDMPAALLVLLATRDTSLMRRVFPRVVDNGRMLRGVFQMVRSGRFGRRALSSSLQRAFQTWLNEATPDKLLAASIGKNPSLRDVLRLARPTPKDDARRALFGWLADRPVERWAPAVESDLPREVRALVAFRQAATADEQVAILEELRARWDLLADSAKGPAVWTAIARRMGPQALRMNLNTLARHGVFAGAAADEMVRFVAERLADADEIRRSRQFPYQFLAAYLNADENLPHALRAALCSAAETACGNVPRLRGPVVIGLDVSGSMSSAVTGRHGETTATKVRCVDVAALFAAAMLRANPDSVVIPFDGVAHEARLDAGDTVLSLAQRLAAYGGGSTNCALPILAAMTRWRDRAFVGCVLISDLESWVGRGRHGSTGVMTAWEAFIDHQRRIAGRAFDAPRLACVDVQAGVTTQAAERADILNIGGFSDAVFHVVAGFFGGGAERFVAEVEAIEL